MYPRRLKLYLPQVHQGARPFPFRKIFLPINRRYIGGDHPDQGSPGAAAPPNVSGRVGSDAQP